MKKLIILTLVLLLSTAGYGEGLYEEHFDYADDAALAVEWPGMGAPWAGDPTLYSVVTPDGDGQAAKVSGGSSMRHSLGGIEEFALGGTISFDWLVDTENGIRPYNFQIERVVGLPTSGSIYAPGFQSGNYALNVYQGAPHPDTPLGLTLVEGWNSVEISVAADGTMGYTVNNVTSAFTIAPGFWSGVGVITVFDWMVGDTGSSVYDNIVITPEPMTLCLLGLGGLLIRRKRTLDNIET